MEIAAAIMATFFAGAIRTSVGVGAGIFLTACLSLLFDPKMTLAVIAFLQIGFGSSAIFHYWRRWDQRLALNLIATSLLGVIAGSWLVTLLPAVWLRHIFGGVIIFFSIFEWWRPVRGAESPTQAGNMTFGLAAGLAGSMANGAGAVLALYLRRLELDYFSVLGTLSLVVMATDISRLFFYWHFEILNGTALSYAVLLLPVIFGGGWVGVRIRDRAPELWLRRAILSLILVIGIMLLIR